MSRGKILIVDDETDLSATLDGILRARRYEVISASDGEEGLKKAKSEKPDLIMLDIVMPDIDGYEVCSRLKSDNKTSKIPIIMFSAISESSAIERAYKAKASDYIVKPFNLPVLFSKIGKFLPQKGKG